MVHCVAPVDPRKAERVHIKVEVKLNVLITKTGEVNEIHVVYGDPALIPAAAKAVKSGGTLPVGWA